MSGIAGIIDLTGRRAIPSEVLQRLSDAMAHRGPDGQRLVRRAGVGLVFRHLETYRRKTGWSPAHDEGQDIVCVLDGLLTNVKQLDPSGRLVIGRDRFGVCPLHWTRQGDWLLFASEIKALLASGLVATQVDVRGINHVFTFFGVPGPITCFAGIQALDLSFLQCLN